MSQNSDLFLRYKFTDRGGSGVYDVYPADDHMTMLKLMGEVRLKPDDLEGESNGDTDDVRGSEGKNPC